VIGALNDHSINADVPINGAFTPVGATFDLVGFSDSAFGANGLDLFDLFVPVGFTDSEFAFLSVLDDQQAEVLIPFCSQYPGRVFKATVAGREFYSQNPAEALYFLSQISETVFLSQFDPSEVPLEIFFSQVPEHDFISVQVHDETYESPEFEEIFYSTRVQGLFYSTDDRQGPEVTTVTQTIFYSYRADDPVEETFTSTVPAHVFLSAGTHNAAGDNLC
jgi:hypothetical protein